MVRYLGRLDFAYILVRVELIFDFTLSCFELVVMQYFLLDLGVPGFFGVALFVYDFVGCNLVY